MSLKARLQKAVVEAMRAKEKSRLEILRLIQAAVKQFEVDEQAEADDAKITSLLDKLKKQRQESIKMFEQAGRAELVEKEAYQLDVIQSFLPEPMPMSEVASLVASAIQETGADSIKDMSKVMAALKSHIQGRADMGQVSALVREKLS